MLKYLFSLFVMPRNLLRGWIIVSLPKAEKIPRTLFREVSFLFIITLLFPVNISAEQINPVEIRSLDITYEVGIGSEIFVTEKIVPEEGQTGEYVRTIPKKLSAKVNPKKEDVNYAIYDIKAFAKDSKTLEYKVKEDNESVKILVNLSDIPKGTEYITIKYKIERAIGKILKDDDISFRNNIELFAYIYVLGESDHRYKSLSAKIVSSHAELVNMECYAGDVGFGQRMCLTEFDKNAGKSSSTSLMGEGKEFLIAFKFLQGGDVKTPNTIVSVLSQTLDYLRINWLFILIFILLIFIIFKIVRKTLYIEKV